MSVFISFDSILFSDYALDWGSEVLFAQLIFVTLTDFEHVRNFIFVTVIITFL